MTKIDVDGNHFRYFQVLVKPRDTTASYFLSID